ncbi:hypothetical protein [Candidatus Nitrososphaera sp. FF02]|uniref:hypothetical protein n=1 Tax=Candidatus Nitrososphaera sp. FF02 TaxID=3398226 RepID=UPI0039E86E7A
MPLKGLSGSLSFVSFLDKLKFHQKSSNEEVRILTYITNLPSNDLFESMTRFGFKVEYLGEIVQVSIQDPNSDGQDGDVQPSIYYCYHDTQRSLLLCFTYDTIEEAIKKMDKFVNQRRGIAPIWIHPLTFDKIRKQILERYPKTLIVEFHASRVRREREEAVLREQYQDRYFQYNGDDGRHTLDEISRSYGVLPHSIVFVIPNLAKFRITNKGKFTFNHGEIEVLFEIINELLSEFLERKKIIDRAKAEFIPMNFGKGEVKVPHVIPVDIVFSREVEFLEVQKLIDNMGGDDFNFEIFDTLLIQGSVHLSGTVIDKNKNTGFNITCNSDRVTLSPTKDTPFDSLMQFYKMITERLDLNARVELSPGITG